MSFTQLGLPAQIVEGVRAAGYSKPTPIQQRAIPIILSGHDLVGASQTGTGKTAAFLLPILTRLSRAALRAPVFRALILTPTRELAAQVEASAREYARFTDLEVGVVFGGVPIGPQERMLRHEGVDLLVATPGRLLDLNGRQSVSFEDVEVVVLDEADRMVDMGFAPDLRRILRLLRSDRQTLMFSATMPAELNQVAAEALRRPQRLDLGERSQPAPKIAQEFIAVTRDRKIETLSQILGQESTRRALVFVRSKRGADRLVRRLQDLGHKVAALHGDRSQSQRERALLDFRRGRVPFLVATDIASRGIDVDGVTHVINFDVPAAAEDYIHRIGRTGRMHASGKAITLTTPEEREQVRDIERLLGRAVDRVTLPGATDRSPAPPAADRGGHRRGSAPAGRDSGRSRTPHSAPSRGTNTGAERGHRAGSEAPARRTPVEQPARATATESDSEAHGRRRRLNPADRRSRRRM